jgi:hypothetical protein
VGRKSAAPVTSRRAISAKLSICVRKFIIGL